MKTQELFEAAQLDAMGLLDAQEQADFEAALMAASPALRAQIREEQARYAKPERLPAGIEPATDLRARVLDAVKADIASVFGSKAPARASLPHAAGRAIPSAQPVRRATANIWRGLALACMTAAVVLGVVVAQQNATMKNLAAASNTDTSLSGLVSVFGANNLVDVVFTPNTKQVAFAPALPDSKAQAAIWYNNDRGSAHVICRNLPVQSNETVRLVTIDDNGKVVSELAEFDSNGGFASNELHTSNFNPKQLAIYVAARGAKAASGRLVLIASA
ncbi:MAG: hypothetical protein K2Y21_00805 [Phycisphaerales bacterium]|nr:hypothetical protein [Phycisphaerales bacterium]